MRTCIFTLLLSYFFSLNAFAMEDSLQNRIREYERYAQTLPKNDNHPKEVLEQLLIPQYEVSFREMLGDEVDLKSAEFQKLFQFMVETDTTFSLDKELNDRVNREVFISLFTANELHEIANFFHSPAGKSFTEKSLTVMMISMEKTRQYSLNKPKPPSLLERMKAYLDSNPKLTEELCIAFEKRGHDKKQDINNNENLDQLPKCFHISK